MTHRNAHQTAIKVRGYHLDVYGHVNNARYLEFLEEARWGFMEEFGDLPWFMERKLALVISRIDIRYVRPATMGDELLIYTHVDSLGERDGMIAQRVVRADNAKLVASAEVTFAVVHPDLPGARPFTGELAEKFSLLRAGEQEKLCKN